MGETVIGLLHPGEMGAAVGKVLREQGHSVLWASAGRSTETTQRAHDNDLEDAGSLAELTRRSNFLLSICPPHAAMDVARAVAGFQGVFVEANAVSPTTTRKVAGLITESGGDCVDGGIIGPPPTRHATTRLYLSGGRATVVSELFTGSRLDSRLIGEEVGAASALKMAYAGYTKGSAALLLAIRALARAEGVEAALLREWGKSQPELRNKALAAARSATAKGWRWVGEMEEIEQAMAADGLPPGFHHAAAEVYRRSPRSAEAPESASAIEATLEAVTNALLADVDHPQGELPGQTSLL